MRQQCHMNLAIMLLLSGACSDDAGAPSCEQTCAAGRARGCPRCDSSCEAVCRTYPWTAMTRSAMVRSSSCRFGFGGSDTFAVCDTPR